jgi:hypothetical protein
VVKGCLGGCLRVTRWWSRSGSVMVQGSSIVIRGSSVMVHGSSGVVQDS